MTLSPARRRIATGAIFLGTFMAALSNSIITVALPSIQRDLDIPLSALQWVLGVMAMSLSALMLSSGPISDRYGRKRIWLTGVAIFAAGATVAALAQSFTSLLIGTGIIGAGGALAIPGALSLLTQLYPAPADRTRIIGLWSTFVTGSLVIGPLVGGVLTETHGWHAVFLFLLPIAGAAFAAGALTLPESANPEAAASDIPGQILSVLLLASLSFALISMGQRNGIAAGAAGGIALLAFAVFLRVELRTPRPALPVDLLRQTPFAVASTLSFLLGLCGYSTTFLYSLLLQKGLGLGPSATGIALLPYFVAMVLTSANFGRLTRRFGLHDTMTAGYAVLALGQAGMALIGPEPPQAVLTALFVISGLGLGLAVPSAGAAGMAAAPRARTGAVSSCINTLRQAGLTIGIGLLGSLLSLGAGSNPQPSGYVSGFTLAIAISALLCASGVALLLLTRARISHPHQGKENT